MAQGKRIDSLEEQYASLGTNMAEISSKLDSRDARIEERFLSLEAMIRSMTEAQQSAKSATTPPVSPGQKAATIPASGDDTTTTTSGTSQVTQWHPGTFSGMIGPMGPTQYFPGIGAQFGPGHINPAGEVARAGGLSWGQTPPSWSTMVHAMSHAAVGLSSSHPSAWYGPGITPPSANVIDHDDGFSGTGMPQPQFSGPGGGPILHGQRPQFHGGASGLLGPFGNSTDFNGHRGQTGYEGRQVPGFDNRVRKLKMPVFDGTDAHDWVYRAERYFSVTGLTEAEQLAAAGLCMEGRALAWYRWCEQRRPLRSWTEPKTSLLERFRPTQDGSPSEQFFGITQTGTVMDYRDRFELLSSQMIGFTDADLTANFLKGLKPELKAAVRTMYPRDLAHAMSIAQLLEDQRRIERSNRGGMWIGSSRATGNNRPTGVAVTDGKSIELGSKGLVGGLQPGDVNRLSPAE